MRGVEESPCSEIKNNEWGVGERRCYSGVVIVVSCCVSCSLAGDDDHA